MVTLKGDERLDYLLAENLRIIQSPTVFAFSLDAVLLARFASISLKRGSIIDLCSGNGVIPLLMSARTKVPITGVEIQERLYDMAIRNMEYNELEDQITMIHGDLKDAPSRLGREKHNLVTCNPPYFLSSSREIINMNEHLAIARHEICCTLEDCIRSSSQLLKQGGRAAFVHRPGRLLDLVTLMRKYRLEPKRLRFVYPRQGKEANTVLIEGLKDGAPDIKVLPPLYIYDQQGEYTEEIREMLYGNEQ
ncbi:tRNA1(Val) (adenine(37)-N6)-methyltransferase [Bacillus sp. Hm123]|uniref:tRNA1(Val) (adenine(37)-N6)-methyltransferase n=1 Tax=Bacillus sp. Hm123 TaxID=3450745 RepID=UPI003F43BE2E